MAKKVKAVIKLQLPAGKATPAPPVGPALGQHGVNIMAFCKEYNDRTASQEGTIIPVELTIYDDRSFSFILKTPPTAELLLSFRNRARQQRSKRAKNWQDIPGKDSRDCSN